VKPHKLASTVDLSTTGPGDLSIEQLTDGTLQLARRDHAGHLVAAIAILSSELPGLSDVAGLARIEFNTPPVSARAPGPSRFDPDGRAA
jgi:hypothetical protein